MMFAICESTIQQNLMGVYAIIILILLKFFMRITLTQRWLFKNKDTLLMTEFNILHFVLDVLFGPRSKPPTNFDGLV